MHDGIDERIRHGGHFGDHDGNHGDHGRDQVRVAVLPNQCHDGIGRPCDGVC